MEVVSPGICYPKFDLSGFPGGPLFTAGWEIQILVATERDGNGPARGTYVRSRDISLALISAFLAQPPRPGWVKRIFTKPSSFLVRSSRLVRHLNSAVTWHSACDGSSCNMANVYQNHRRVSALARIEQDATFNSRAFRLSPRLQDVLIGVVRHALPRRRASTTVSTDTPGIVAQAPGIRRSYARWYDRSGHGGGLLNRRIHAN